MSKIKIKFVCTECGTESVKWLGRCPGCGAWATMVEEKSESLPGGKKRYETYEGAVSLSLNEIESTEEERLRTGIGELDRVLGGGIVSSSLVLIGGDPGIGKSTLLLQVCSALSGKISPILYVSGEESQRQIKLRSNRMGIEAEDVYIYPETNMSMIESEIDRLKPGIIIIDSIQTVYDSQVTSAPGSVSQVRECTTQLLRIAKNRGISIFIIGHVTKDGMIAGPRILEHIVDTVLYFEGERNLAFRILRCVKNRFGSTNEIGIFEMRDRGLIEVSNPSEIFLSGRQQQASGSIVLASMEGTRPVLVEMQALVTANSGYGSPRRSALGLDYNRVALIIAVLEKRVGFSMFNHDVYVSVVGGMRIDEPAADLGIALALASSLQDIALPQDMAVAGEIGLTGEIRQIGRIEQRIKEAEKLGFSSMMLSASGCRQLAKDTSLKLIPVETLKEALEKIIF